MRYPTSRTSGKSSIDLIEEAVHALRAAPASTLATYYAGAIPFVVGFLFYWTDMSKNPFAGDRLAEGALVTAALFIWMKFCQAVFARRVREHVASQPMHRWSVRQYIRLFLTQVLVQPSGLFLIPLSILLVAPFGWVYAFYQNVTALADPDSREGPSLVRRALRQTSLWPVQNFLTLAIVAGFAIFIFLDLALASFLAPRLLKQFLGIETVFSRSPLAMLNSTFVAAIFGLAYLCIDPLVKTIYTLRCFYGESLESGEDLKTSMKQFATSSRVLASTALLAMIFGFAVAAVAAPQGTPPAPAEKSAGSNVSHVELNRNIDEVIQQRKYAWRIPAEAELESDAEKGMLTKFLIKVVRFVSKWTEKISDWIWEMLRKLLGMDPVVGGSRNFAWMSSSLLLYVLLAAVLAILAVYFIRVSRRKKTATAALTLDVLSVPPDITDENVRADQWPEDRWVAMARELLEKGQLRLAMRAFYLASLAHLARRNLIGIARFKSNRDYENELRRRGHAIPDMLTVFGANVAMFERVWYGTHGIDTEQIQAFSANVDKIRNGS